MNGDTPTGGNWDSKEGQRLIAELRKIEDEHDLGERINKLAWWSFGNTLCVSDRLRELRSRLPVRPWVLNLLGGVSLAGLLALAYAGGSRFAKLDARDDALCVQMEATCDQVKINTGRIDRTERRLARIDGNLDMLLQNRGLRPLPAVDSTDSL